MDAPGSSPPPVEARIDAIERPHPRLLRYYLVRALVFGPLVVFALPFFYFRYRTLRYRFDREGISMAWGALFRREVDLTYSRIQDIHLSSNVIERWMGLARIEIQTASGSAKAEMVIEGIPEFEELRDFLYARMRGVSVGTTADGSGPPARDAAPAGAEDELASVLGDVAAELRALREALRTERRAPARIPPGDSGAR